MWSIVISMLKVFVWWKRETEFIHCRFTKINPYKRLNRDFTQKWKQFCLPNDIHRRKRHNPSTHDSSIRNPRRKGGLMQHLKWGSQFEKHCIDSRAHVQSNPFGCICKQFFHSKAPNDKMMDLPAEWKSRSPNTKLPLNLENKSICTVQLFVPTYCSVLSLVCGYLLGFDAGSNWKKGDIRFDMIKALWLILLA